MSTDLKIELLQGIFSSAQCVIHRMKNVVFVDNGQTNSLPWQLAIH